MGDSLPSIQSSAGHVLNGDVIKKYIHTNEQSREQAYLKKEQYYQRMFNDDKGRIGYNTSKKI